LVNLPVKNFACFIFLFVFTQAAWGQQKETGLYFTVKCNKHVSAKLVILTSKSVCLTNNPIILSNDFESVSKVMNVSDQVYFDLKLTSPAYNRLLKIQTSFPNSELALVIEGNVFTIYKMTNTQAKSILRIQGPRNNIDLFILMQSRLQKLLTSSNQNKIP